MSSAVVDLNACDGRDGCRCTQRRWSVHLFVCVRKDAGGGAPALK